MLISRSGFAKSASTCEDCWPAGVLAIRDFFAGRFERLSALVGIDSGMFSDMLSLLLMLVMKRLWRESKQEESQESACKSEL